MLAQKPAFESGEEQRLATLIWNTHDTCDHNPSRLVTGGEYEVTKRGKFCNIWNHSIDQVNLQEFVNKNLF